MVNYKFMWEKIRNIFKPTSKYFVSFYFSGGYGSTVVVVDDFKIDPVNTQMKLSKMLFESNKTQDKEEKIVILSIYKM